MSYSALELLALLIVTLGIALQAWVGIGFGLLSAPLLYLINPAYVPGPILALGFVLSLMIVLNGRHELYWRRIVPASIARVPGSWCGALLLISVSSHVLSLVFGGALLLAVLVTWRAHRLKTSALNLCIGGFFSGLIGTATSVGGPPIALVYQESDRVRARNELAAFFMMGIPVSILLLVNQGAFDQDDLYLSVKMLPGVLFGFILARWFEGKVNCRSAKPAVLLVSAFCALLVLYRGVSVVAST